MRKQVNILITVVGPDEETIDHDVNSWVRTRMATLPCFVNDTEIVKYERVEKLPAS